MSASSYSYEVTVTHTSGAQTVLTGDAPRGPGVTGNAPRLYTTSADGGLHVTFDNQFYTFASGEWASVEQVIAV